MARMPLCLLLPGLLWPAKAHYDTARDHDLPALAGLLGRGRIERRPGQPWEAWLCNAFGIETAEPPVAALRLLGAGFHPGDAFWICADAAHLGLERTTLALSAVGFDDLDAAAAEELAAALAPALAPLGELRGGAAGRGYLRLKEPPAIATTPPSAALGRRADTVEPRGAAAAQWRRNANEAQMCLHRHPLNERRTAAGLLPVNSLWFWGAGRLPPQRPCPFAAAWGDAAAAPLLQGLAAWGEIAFAAAPPDGDALLAGHNPNGIVVLTGLLPATQALDALAWRGALAALERHWLAPLGSALRRGRLDRLTLVGLGDETSVEVTATAADRYRFWRKPLPLADLVPPR